MMPIESTSINAIARRRLLLGTAALVSMPLTSCGGGSHGGGTGDGGGGGGGASNGPTGSLVYRNSGVAAVYNFTTSTELQFDPLTSPFVKVGMAVSPGKLITSSIEGDGRTYFDVGIFGLDGKLSTTLRMRRPLATQTGAAVFNANGSRLALSLNEQASATNNNRIGRVVVLEMPSGQTVATIDGYAEPIWLSTSGELLVRDAVDERMFVVGADLRTVTRLPNLTSSTKTGAYNATADGRYIVYQGAASNSSILAFDRTNGTSWVAATDRLSDLTSPVVSPDGRFLAVFSRDLLSTRPHIVPFAPNVTVAVDRQYALTKSIGECGWRMGWCA
jgi:hypothetical protein